MSIQIMLDTSLTADWSNSSATRDSRWKVKAMGNLTHFFFGFCRVLQSPLARWVNDSERSSTARRQYGRIRIQILYKSRRLWPDRSVFLWLWLHQTRYLCGGFRLAVVLSHNPIAVCCQNTTTSPPHPPALSLLAYSRFRMYFTFSHPHSF